jgi:hypothetical protein
MSTETANSEQRIARSGKWEVGMKRKRETARPLSS